MTDMSNMFSSADSFNQPLNEWDVSSVTTLRTMFFYATAFNQPLNDWDVSHVTNMSFMFRGAASFDQPLNDWDVSSVTNMRAIFNEAISFNQILNNWDVSNVTNMGSMFSGAESFNQALNNWDISNVGEMTAMFYEAFAFNQDLSSWNFNSSVEFNNYPFSGFVANSGLDISNYDALLARFAQLGLQNKRLYSEELYYCDEISRNTLINDLGWLIQFDTLSEDCEMAVPENTMASIDIYPVPTGNSLFLKIPAGTELKHVEIFNTQGKKIKTSAVNLQEINVENLAAGYYLIKLYTKENMFVKKFIKI